eukprot:Skav230147  [mRNA]  locus=scaffold1301:267704:272380:+ [translate_table: standard]
MAYVEYTGYPGVVHARLLLSLVEGTEWIILTPDYDRYPEDLHIGNPDFSQFFHIPDGSLPPGIPARNIYAFAPMTAREYAQHMHDGRADRDAELGRRGLAAPLPPPVGAPAVGAVPVAQPAGGAAPGAAGASFWVLGEMVEGHKIGERVQVPANMPTLGDVGLMSMLDQKGIQRTVVVKQLTSDQLGGYCDERIKNARSSESVEGDDQIAAEDVRTMAIQYNMNRERLRGFRESVGEMVQCAFEDFPMEPRTAMEYLKAVGSIAESCYSQHLAWVQQAKIPDSNRAIHEDELLARVLDACICYDCLNPSNLLCMELVVRRRQLIAQAHSLNPSAPSYDGADLFLGNQYRSGGGIVVPSLRDHVYRGNVCRAVFQRIQSRNEKIKRVNLAINALNSLYFGGSTGGTSATIDDLSLATMVQRDAISDIMEKVSDLGVPPKACRSEALKVLRTVDASGYSEPDVASGSTVPMDLGIISLPDGSVGGVDLLGALSGSVKEMVENYDDFLLQDASSWNVVADCVGNMKPYNDPLLSSRKGYLDFLAKLYRSGVLDFSHTCLGRVGAFCVAKKPKLVNGVLKSRQRLVLDCRQTNALFKPPPQTRLGSLAALAEAELCDNHQLYLSGADIRDCFYAVVMPPGLRNFFGLAWNISAEEVSLVSGGMVHWDRMDAVPVIKVLPMGFNWSFFLVQHIHTELSLHALGVDERFLFLEGKPAPSLSPGTTCLMPYCDNVHSISVDPQLCQVGKDTVCAKLEEIGFSLHEHSEASSLFETLGGIVDGSKGVVRASHKRMWQLIYAFEAAADCIMDVKSVQRLLGHAMVVCVLNRSGMSVFRRLYDFISSGTAPRRFTASERDECLAFAGLVPLLVADIRRPYSDTITCTDSSPFGYGICEQTSSTATTRQHGRWIERWRFKRLPAEQWKPRERSAGWDVLGDVRTVQGSMAGDDDDILNYIPNDDFPEIPDELMKPQLWRTVKMGKWQHTHEHITLKEGRAFLIALRRLSRSREHRRKRHLFLVDNLSLCFAIAKGRSHSFELLRVLQKAAALSLACGLTIRPRWIRSEVNVADGPSRGHIQPGVAPSGKPDQAASAKYLKEFRSVNSVSEESEEVSDVEGSSSRSSQVHPEAKSIPGAFDDSSEPTSKASSSEVCALIPEDAGKRAQQFGMTILEEKSVSSEILSQYKGYLRKLEVFSRANDIPWPLEKTEADLVLADFMDILYLDKKNPSEGEKVLAALEFFRNDLKGLLPRSRKALKGWRKVMPSQSRLPIPMLLVFGICMLMCAKGKMEMALKVLTDFDLYLRPGEGMSLRARNVVPPVAAGGRQYRLTHVVVKDFEGGQPDKVGVFDNSIRLDNPKTMWIADHLLQLARKKDHQDSLLFSFTMEQFRKEFAAAGLKLGVNGLHPYQLRHGGASQDLGSGFRDHNAVKARGRWRTDQSVRRYAKIGRVQHLLAKLSPSTMQFCQWSENNLERVFKGIIPARTM